MQVYLNYRVYHFVFSEIHMSSDESGHAGITSQAHEKTRAIFYEARNQTYSHHINIAMKGVTLRAKFSRTEISALENFCP